MNNSATAGIIIIGNEILSGKVHDVNSYYLACELRKLGVDLRRISVVSDHTGTIGREVAEFSKEYDYVFTCGGVGPTHDDVTMAGIAEGFGIKLVEHPEIKNLLLTKYKDMLNDSVTKMAFVPEGSKIELKKSMRFPVISFRNVYILPGNPEYVRSKFHFISEKISSSAFYLNKIYLKCHESEIAEALSNIAIRNEHVDFGSYPAIGNPEYLVMITADSRSKDHLVKATEEFLKEIPPAFIVRTDLITGNTGY